MRSRALRFHLDVHDKRQGLMASAGAVALRTAARKLRRASSHSSRITKRRILLFGRASAAREPRYRCPWLPSAVQTCLGNSCKQPAYFSRGIDRRTSLEVLVPRSSKSGLTRRAADRLHRPLNFFVMLK